MEVFDVSPGFKIGDVVLVTCGPSKGEAGEVIARFNSEKGTLYQVSLIDCGVDCFPASWLKILIRRKQQAF